MSYDQAKILAQKLANESGETYHLFRICCGEYDICLDKDLEGKKSHTKIVPLN
jgi:hypothetical protein